MNIKPIGSISILDVEASEIPGDLIGWLLDFNPGWADAINEEHIINPYADLSEVKIEYIDDSDLQAQYLDVIKQFQDLCETFNCQYIRLI